MTPKVAYDTDTEMTLVRGDLAVEQGRYRVRNVRRGSDVEEGKYLHVWRRVEQRLETVPDHLQHRCRTAHRGLDRARSRGRYRRFAMSTRLFRRFRDAEPAGEAAASGAKSPREALNEQWLRIRAGLGGSPAIDSMDAVYRAELRDLRSAEIQACALVDEIWVTLLNGPLAERVSQYVAALRRRTAEHAACWKSAKRPAAIATR